MVESRMWTLSSTSGNTSSMRTLSSRVSGGEEGAAAAAAVCVCDGVHH